MKLFYRSASILLGFVFLYYIFSISEKVSLQNFTELVLKLNPLKVFFCFLLYMGAHFVRVLRFSVMIGRQDFSLISLINIQYYTNAINLILPFKLGEVYRIIEFNKVIKDIEKSFFTIVAERGIDFLLIFFGLFGAVYFTEQSFFELRTTVAIGILFILSILFVFFVLPQNLRFLNIFIAKRYNSKKVVNLLRVSSKVHDSIESMRNILTREKSTLFVLSLVIWSMELGSFYYINDFLPHYKYTILLGCLVFLAGILPSGILGVGGIQLAFFLVFRNYVGQSSIELSLSYQLFIFLPAVILGFAVSFIYKFIYLNKKPHTDGLVKSVIY